VKLRVEVTNSPLLDPIARVATQGSFSVVLIPAPPADWCPSRRQCGRQVQVWQQRKQRLKYGSRLLTQRVIYGVLMGLALLLLLL